MRQNLALAMNTLNPHQMSPADRLDEIGDLLAAALIRLLARKSSSLSGDDGEMRLDFSPTQRGHGRHGEREVSG